MEVALLKEFQWFGRTTRRPGSLARDMMHGMMEEKDKKRTWIEMTACVREAEDRQKCKRIVQPSKCHNGYRNVFLYWYT